MSDNPYRLKGEWQTYLRRVLPDDASEVQLSETRRAFYSGASCLLTLLVRQLEPGSEATEADLHMMDFIEKEIGEFAADIKKGKA